MVSAMKSPAPNYPKSHVDGLHWVPFSRGSRRLEYIRDISMTKGEFLDDREMAVSESGYAYSVKEMHGHWACIVAQRLWANDWFLRGL